MKMYKGFNKDMTCRGFQYEEGKTYVEDEAVLGEKGFHACEDPLDCFYCYAPGNSVFHEVDLDATEETCAVDSRRCGKRITINRRLSFTDILKAHQEYVQSQCTSTIGDTSNGKENAFGVIMTALLREKAAMQLPAIGAVQWLEPLAASLLAITVLQRLVREETLLRAPLALHLLDFGATQLLAIKEVLLLVIVAVHWQETLVMHPLVILVMQWPGKVASHLLGAEEALLLAKTVWRAASAARPKVVLELFFPYPKWTTTDATSLVPAPS